MRTLASILAIALLASVLHAEPATQPADSSRAAFIEDVAAIGAPGIPGPLCVFGPDAFTVVAATSDDLPAPLVAASTLGKGRLVAFGHEGYFGGEALRTADTSKLVS